MIAGGEPLCDDRHPRGDETILVVEVSDSSLAFDRRVKGAMYARAGVPEYWIVDVQSRQVLVFREARNGQYRSSIVLGEDETIAPVAAPWAAIAVREIFS